MWFGIKILDDSERAGEKILGFVPLLREQWFQQDKKWWTYFWSTNSSNTSECDNIFSNVIQRIFQNFNPGRSDSRWCFETWRFSAALGMSRDTKLNVGSLFSLTWGWTYWRWLIMPIMVTCNPSSTVSKYGVQFRKIVLKIHNSKTTTNVFKWPVVFKTYLSGNSAFLKRDQMIYPRSDRRWIFKLL